MLPKEDKIRLQHMVDAANEALSFVKGVNQENLYTDRKLALSLVRLIEIIGEAASQISPEIRELYSEIPWQSIVGMRNRLIHAYFDIDLNLVWGTVIDDLPSLISGINQILSSKT
jgi:uncharacterized protein with HEPN domain